MNTVQILEEIEQASMEATAMMYGEAKKISYYAEDLLWGKKCYQNLRFVLVWLNGIQTILVSTDLSLTPIEIIELYCRRFKVECSFRELKQVVSGFSYRFWSKHMPKLNRYKTNEFHQEKQAEICDESERKCITKTVKAIECFTLLSCIALGLLQIVSILFSGSINSACVRFMRTPSKDIPSEATTADFMRKTIYQLFKFHSDLTITAEISSKQSAPIAYEDTNCA